VKEVALIKAMEEKLNRHISNPEVKAQAIQHMRNDIAERMDRGQAMPVLTLQETRQREMEAKKEVSYERA